MTRSLDQGAVSEQDAAALIDEYTPLVEHVVRRMRLSLPPTVGEEDLIEVGKVGLLHAQRQFDPTRGASFKTFAFLAVRGAVLDELRRHDILGRGQRSAVAEFEETRRSLQSELGRTPTFLEIQEQLGLSTAELRDVLRSQALAAAVKSSPDVEHEAVVHDGLRARAVSPEEHVELEEAKSLLTEEMRRLPPREQDILFLYFHGGLPLKEIGIVLEICESRVSQLVRHSLLVLNQRLSRRGVGS